MTSLADHIKIYWKKLLGQECPLKLAFRRVEFYFLIDTCLSGKNKKTNK